MKSKTSKSKRIEQLKTEKKQNRLAYECGAINKEEFILTRKHQDKMIKHLMFKMQAT